MSDGLRRDFRLLRLGIAGELRNPALRLLWVILVLGSALYAWQQGDLAASTAVVIATGAGRGFALAACLWFASGALRDQNPRLGAVLRSKPVDGGRWVLLTWGTGAGLWLVMLTAPFLGAMLGQIRWSGLLAISAHGLGFLRAALIMLPVTTVGFALSRLTLSPLGATVIALAFLCVMAGLQFVPPYLRPDYTQNLALYVASAMFLMVLVAFLVERARRGELRQPVLPIVGILCTALLAYGSGFYAYRAAAAPTDGSVPDMMTRQYIELGKQIPGFWLSDSRGGLVRTSSYPGKVLFIYFFASDDMEAARTLPALNALQQKFGPQGVQAVAICFSPDHGDGAAITWTGGFQFPVGTDLTTIKTSQPPQASLATAYNVESLPVLVVTDRRHRAHDILKDVSYDQERLFALAQARLGEEPE